MKPYFRPGVGVVIYNAAGEILTFSRSDKPDIWQFPQGGMDADESTEVTLWRELEEETGLVAKNFTETIEYPSWTVYTYPDTIKNKLHYKGVLGQVHRWYFLKINAGVEVNLDLAVDKEFTDHRFVTFDDFLAQNDVLKAEVYAELFRFFNLKILPLLNKE